MGLVVQLAVFASGLSAGHQRPISLRKEFGAAIRPRLPFAIDPKSRCGTKARLSMSLSKET